jgi:hypothetical protein
LMASALRAGTRAAIAATARRITDTPRTTIGSRVPGLLRDAL